MGRWSKQQNRQAHFTAVKSESTATVHSQIEKTTRSNYIEMIRYKTSELIACSLKMGALIGGLSNRYSDLFYEYGVNLGIAFQIQDDYLDIFGRKKIFGK